jgi:hypothetical protein
MEERTWPVHNKEIDLFFKACRRSTLNDAIMKS